MAKAEVWIVDDEVQLADFCAEIVNEEKCSSRVFYSADQALKEFNREDCKYPDLIISDVKMPGTDGFSFIQQCRQKNMAQPVIIISGWVERNFFAKTADLGVLAVLDKPFKSEQLRELVLRGLREFSTRQIQSELLELYKVQTDILERMVSQYLMRAAHSENRLHERGISLFDDEKATKDDLSLGYKLNAMHRSNEDLNSKIENLWTKLKTLAS